MSVDVEKEDIRAQFEDPEKVPEHWEVVFDGLARVRTERSRRSDILCFCPIGTVVDGRKRGRWLELDDDCGFMMISCAGEVVLRRQLTYTILVERKAGRLPGIIWCTTPLGLVIQKIMPNGLIGEWNKANHSRRVRQHDRILEVNGIRDRARLLQEWKTQTIFVLKILRLEGTNADDMEDELAKDTVGSDIIAHVACQDQPCVYEDSRGEEDGSDTADKRSEDELWDPNEEEDTESSEDDSTAGSDEAKTVLHPKAVPL